MERKLLPVEFSADTLATGHRVGLALVANDSDQPEQGVILGLFQGKGEGARLLGIRGLNQEQARGLALSLLEMADHARAGTQPREVG